jgi:hypothetical protein
MTVTWWCNAIAIIWRVRRTKKIWNVTNPRKRARTFARVHIFVFAGCYSEDDLVVDCSNRRIDSLRTVARLTPGSRLLDSTSLFTHERIVFTLTSKKMAASLFVIVPVGLFRILFSIAVLRPDFSALTIMFRMTSSVPGTASFVRASNSALPN